MLKATTPYLVNTNLEWEPRLSKGDQGACNLCYSGGSEPPSAEAVHTHTHTHTRETCGGIFDTKVCTPKWLLPLQF